jgi:acetyl-CoA C-acetyltransferase
MARRAGIVGVGQTKYGRRFDVSTPELAGEAARAALAHANVAARDIDAIFIGTAPDALIGVADADFWVADYIGGIGKPVMRISTGGTTGATAAIAAHDAVASGRFDLVLAIAVERAGESRDVQALMNTNIDPIFERAIGLNAISVYALVAVDHMVRHGTTERHLAIISSRNHRNALNNPFAHLQLDLSVEDVLASQMLCWPIKLYDTCPASDGACAVVVAAEHTHDRSKVAWFSGIASYSDGYFLGDREELSRRRHLEAAARSAYEQAGIAKPLEQIDVAELQNPFTSSELIGIEALGFVEIGGVGRALDAGFGEMTSVLPVNPSGGALSSNPVGATSLIRIAEAALQVTGQAGPRQVEGAKIGLAQCSGGSVQFGCVVILKNGDAL